MNQIIYEPHPVTPERKAELVAQGYKIIDSRFKPVDDEAPKQEKKSKQEKKVEE